MNQTLATLLAASVAFAAAASAQTTVVRGPIANPANGHIYLVVRDDGTSPYEAARAKARELGGDLATIEDSAENEWIRAAMLMPLGSKAWIGLNDSQAEGQFQWSDGSTSGYRNWAAGEPANSTTADFVQMFDTDGRWACRPVSGASLAVIELPGVIRVPQLVPTIQAAVSLAVDGSGFVTEIVLGPGTYSGTILADGRNLRIRGGGAGVTVLDGMNSGRVLLADSGESIELIGLTVTRGRYAGTGGAILSSGSLIATDCVFRNNEASAMPLQRTTVGGAVGLEGAIARFDGCVFEDNRSALTGGAMFADESHVVISRSIFRRNMTGTAATSDDEIGVLHSNRSTYVMSNCVIVGNRPGNSAGKPAALCVDADAQDYNQAGSFNVSNCTIAGNDTNTGPVISVSPGNATFANSIIMVNDAPLQYTFGRVLYQNCLSDARGRAGTFINADPMFVDFDGADGVVGTDDDDPRLRAGSPAIDAGDGMLYLGPPVDVAGAARFSGVGAAGTAGAGAIDIGAHEFVQTRCAADVDDGSGSGTPDGGVSVEDLLYFLMRYDSGC